MEFKETETSFYPIKINFIESIIINTIMAFYDAIIIAIFSIPILIIILLIKYLIM